MHRPYYQLHGPTMCHTFIIPSYWNDCHIVICTMHCVHYALNCRYCTTLQTLHHNAHISSYCIISSYSIMLHPFASYYRHYNILNHIAFYHRHCTILHHTMAIALYCILLHHPAVIASYLIILHHTMDIALYCIIIHHTTDIALYCIIFLHTIEYFMYHVYIGNIVINFMSDYTPFV